MSEWKLIETAPKDGTWVLLAGGGFDYGYDLEPKNGPKCVTAQFTSYLNGNEDVAPRWQYAWYDGGYYGTYENPTHWMPLPSPPK